MADKVAGRIVIDTEIDVSGAKKGVQNLTSEQIKVRNEYRKTAREIEALKEQIKDMETPKMDTSSLDKYESKLQATYDKLADLEAQARKIENGINASVPAGTSEDRLQNMYEHNKAWIEIQKEVEKAYIESEKYEKEIEKIKATTSTGIGSEKYRKAVDSLAKATDRLDMLGKKTKEVDAKQESLVKKIKSIGKEGQKNYTKASNAAGRFAVRLRSIVASAFIFNIISAGLRQLTTYMGNALKSNKQFSDSLAAIKGNLLTAFQPIYNAVMPALNSLMAGLQKITGYIASCISTLFGTTVKASQEGAESLYNQASALDSVAESAKKANRQLSDIDELQVVNKTDNIESTSGGTNNNNAPIFGELEPVEQLPEWLQQSMENIEKLIEDWKIGDFFSVGEDVSNLVVQINEFIAGAISNVDWKTLGKNVGAFLRGIDWLEILKSIGDVIGAALDGAIDFWFGSFSEAPFETALITAMAVWKLTGLGNFLAGKINTALGTSLPTEGFSIISALKVLFELLLAFKIGDKIGSEIAKMLNDEVADILGEDTFFDYVFKYGVADGLKELGTAMDEVLTEFITGVPGKVNKLAEEINDEIKKIGNQKLNLEVNIGNIEATAQSISLIAEKYYNLSQKSVLTDEDLQKLSQYKEDLEKFGIDVSKCIEPETNAWTGTREALDELIASQTEHLKILAYQDAIVEGEKSLMELKKSISDVENEINNNSSYQDIIAQISEMEKAGYSLQNILSVMNTGKNALGYDKYFGKFNKSDVKTAAKLYQSLHNATIEYKNQEQYVNGLYTEIDILNGNVTETNEALSSGTRQLENTGDIISQIGETSEATTNNVKTDFKNMADKGIAQAASLADGTNKALNTIKPANIQANTTPATTAVKNAVLGVNTILGTIKKPNVNANTTPATTAVNIGVSAMNAKLGTVKTPNIQANTSPAISNVNSGVSSINQVLGNVKTPSISLYTSYALKQAGELRSGIETALKGINIGLKVKLQAKVNDAITAAINIGKAAKLGIGQIESYNIPYLATGAVIPPNKKFMAVLGDQKNGMNIEAPADLIKQMVVEGIRESGSSGESEVNVHVYLEGDAEGVFHLVKIENEKEKKQTGRSGLA